MTENDRSFLQLQAFEFVERASCVEMTTDLTIDLRP